MSNRNREYIEFLKQRFDEKKYIEFISDLLNLSYEDINASIIEIKPKQKQFIDTVDYYKFIANYAIGSDKIGIFIIKLTSKGSQNARSSQRSFMSILLNNYNLDASIVAFYQENEPSWRLSFVKKELSFNDKGLKIDLSSAKRYSYLVGENEAVHTAQEYLLKLLDIEDRKITLQDIEKVFDVEKVTKKFFEEYKEKYLELKEFLDNNQDFLTESKKCDFTSEEFAKKLMGQIIFLYFLQKKGWLGVQIIPEVLSIEEYNDISKQSDSVSNNLLHKYYTLDNNSFKLDRISLKNENIKDNINNFILIFKGTRYDKAWGTGDKQFVRNLFRKSRLDHKDNFFDEYLEPFFYTGLNEKRDNQYFALFNCKIPFLNGGLFEPLNNYRWSSAQFNIPDEMFSNGKNGILDIFDHYNFTIDEEEPLEKDIAVDPEMLGKIFENLLDIKDRKSTGSFYTPREIVHYMCQESLANYLVNKLCIPYEDIIKFIKYGDVITQTDWTNIYNDNDIHLLPDSIWNKILEVDKALIDVKVADPAVGSGAFPLGILNEIVKLRDYISSYILILEDKKIISHGDLLPEQINRDYYSMKLQTIQNSIYAVDLEISAVDIAKLRLWLSLIVDYPNDHEPRPLPNLDCKIVQGNSLLDEYEGVTLFSERELSNNLKNYRRNHSNDSSINRISFQQTLGLDGEVMVDYSELLSSMLELQKQYFITSDNKIKKELKNKIDEIQITMVEQSLLYAPNKLERFKQISKKKSKPWFIWKLDFFDVFKNNGGFDIVIANPPYVDSEHMVKTEDGLYLREQCNKKYKSAKGNWDLFVIFIELGFLLLNNYGTLSYIIPNKLISANYAKAIRSLLGKKRLLEIRDYSSIKVFKEASVYPVTIIADNNHTNNDVVMRVMNGMNSIGWSNIIEGHRFYNSINWDTYFSEDVELSSLVEKIGLNKKIIDYNDLYEVKGSATVNEAYITKELLFDGFIKDGIIKFVNTGTIDPFKCLWGIKDTQYIKGKYKNPVILEKELLKKLNNRYIDSKKNKIIIGGMTKIIEAIYDNGNILPGKSTITILGEEDNLKYLLGLLNSKLMTFYYRLYYNSSSLEGGFYSINTEQIKKLPIIIDNMAKNEIIKVVNSLNDNYNEFDFNLLNDLVYNIYSLNTDEIKLIEDYCNEFFIK